MDTTHEARALLRYQPILVPFLKDKKNPMDSDAKRHGLMKLMRHRAVAFLVMLSHTGMAVAQAQGFMHTPTVGHMSNLGPLAHGPVMPPTSSSQNLCTMVAPHLQLGQLRLADLTGGGFVRAFDVVLTCPEGAHIKSLKFVGPEAAQGTTQGYVAQHGTVMVQVRLRDSWQTLQRNTVFDNSQPLLRDFTFRQAETLTIPLEMRLLPGAQLDQGNRQQLLSMEGPFDGALQLSLEQ